MNTMRGRQILFDLHCDTITRCMKHELDLTDDSLQLSIDRLPEHLHLCQAMAVFIPDELCGRDAIDYFDAAYRTFLEQTRKLDARIGVVHEIADVDAILREKPLAMMLSVEGGSVLNGELERLDRLHKLGVKMMTLTWNGANEICGGCATREGFTPFGKRVVARMERLGMAVDVSHLSDAGFWELCDFAEKPFAASHSNARAVCNHRRNLTDGMFREIVRRGGVVGVNYSRGFIVPGGETFSMDDLLRHVHHFLELGGEDAVALGSDFDGTDVPPYLTGVERLEAFIEALERSGIPQAVLQKLLCENARRYFVCLQEGAGR